jgi:purine-binding chemotaxis protein CheW
MPDRDMDAQLFLFSLDERRYALHLDAVEKVLRMVEVTPLLGAADIVLGVVNLQGRVIPVINLRKGFHLPEREPDPSDFLLVARTAERTVALWVDAVIGLVPHAREETTLAEAMASGLDFVEAAVKTSAGITLILDLDAFLSLEKPHDIDRASQDLVTEEGTRRAA